MIMYSVIIIILRFPITTKGYLLSYNAAYCVAELGFCVYNVAKTKL